MSSSFLCKVFFWWDEVFGEGCNIVQKRLPPPLQSCSEDFDNMYFVLPKVYWLRLLFHVDSPLAFLVHRLHFDYLTEGFLASTHVSSRQPLEFLGVVYTL